MSVQPIGSSHGFGSLSSLQQSSGGNDMGLHALRVADLKKLLALIQQRQHEMQRRWEETDAAQRHELGKAQGWSTQNVPSAHEFSHFGNSAMAGNVAVPQRTQQGVPAPHPVQPVQQSSSTQQLSDGDRTRGTTQPLSTSDRDEVSRNEGVQKSSAAEAHTPRNLHHSPEHHRAEVVHHKKKTEEDDNGSVSVTIPASKARQMGLLGPKEKDHPVTATLSKRAAHDLHLIPMSPDGKTTYSVSAADNAI